ncbi:MAG: hypothetical protein Q7I96_05445 [Methanobacteriaceae archaeon]|nr:hypothetical protein [Methanobacteriaceae archaeon]
MHNAISSEYRECRLIVPPPCLKASNGYKLDFGNNTIIHIIMLYKCFFVKMDKKAYIGSFFRFRALNGLC